MFRRLVWRLVRGNRGRLTVALVALVSGAAVISALLNLELDLERKLTREFRSLGANVVLASQPDAQTAGARMAARSLLSESSIATGLKSMNSPDVSASAPYLYIVARAGDTPVVVAGTWLDQAQALAPTWKIEGARVGSRDDLAHCLVGRNVAARFNLRPGSRLDLTYLSQSARVTVAGVIDTGGSEDDQIFLNLPVVQNSLPRLTASSSGNSASPARMRRCRASCKPSPRSFRRSTFVPFARSPKPKAICSTAFAASSSGWPC